MNTYKQLLLHLPSLRSFYTITQECIVSTALVTHTSTIWNKKGASRVKDKPHTVGEGGERDVDVDIVASYLPIGVPETQRDQQGL